MEIFSEYFKKDNLLLRTDARVKLLIALVLLSMVLTYKGLAFPLLMALLCLLFCVRMRIPFRIFILRFSEPVFIAAVVLLLKLFFSGKDELFSFSFIGINLAGHRDGRLEGL
jgi:cobalt/nickel transport system permease protein